MSRPIIRLQVLEPGPHATAWESTQRLRVGRAPSLEISLPDPSLSRRHAEILFVSQQGWVLRDLGSTNGSFLNGIRVDPVERTLEKRDVLQFGNLVFLVTALELEARCGSEEVVARQQIPTAAPLSWEESLELLAMEVTRRTPPSIEAQFRQWSRLSPAAQAQVACKSSATEGDRIRALRGPVPVLLGKSVRREALQEVCP